MRLQIIIFYLFVMIVELFGQFSLCSFHSFHVRYETKQQLCFLQSS